MAVYIPIWNTPPQLQDPVTSVNLSGGSLEFYEAGSDTPLIVYSDEGSTSLGSSVTLNSGGFPSSGNNVVMVFRDQSKAAKVVLKNAAGAVVYTADNIPQVASFDADSFEKLNNLPDDAAATDADSVGGVVNGLQEFAIPFGDFFLPTTSPCGASAITEGTPGLPNYRGYPFDGSTQEAIEFLWSPPKRWNLGKVQVEVFFSSADTGTDGVAWGVKAVALSSGDAFATQYGTPVVNSANLVGAAGMMVSGGKSTDLTVAGSPAANDLVAFRVYRDPDNVNDTLAADAVLLGVKVYWTSNALNDA